MTTLKSFNSTKVRLNVFAPSQVFLPWMLVGTVAFFTMADRSNAKEAQTHLHPTPPVPSLIALSADPNNPKTYCFRANTPSLTSDINVRIHPNGYSYGETTATIHDKATSYYSSYSQKFEGDLKGDRLNLNIITEIEYDTQNTKESWPIIKDSLRIGGITYPPVKCKEDEMFPIPVRIMRLKFKPGSRSAIAENAVVRGTRDIYLVKVKAGQRMRLQISSLEKNAVFDVLAPGGQVLHRESTKVDFRLPSAGEFQIVVGGTRGNAGYRLTVGID